MNFREIVNIVQLARKKTHEAREKFSFHDKGMRKIEVNLVSLTEPSVTDYGIVRKDSNSLLQDKLRTEILPFTNFHRIILEEVCENKKFLILCRVQGILLESSKFQTFEFHIFTI